MARRERIVLEGVPCHITQRGNNRAVIFFKEDDYLQYKEYMQDASERFGCATHAYCLMTNHVHILVTPRMNVSLSKMMQTLGRNYAHYINKKYGRTGTLWEVRFKASLIDANTYLLCCMRYIEKNPVRARMVSKLENYPWSSYHTNGLNKADNLITPHLLYLSLGKDRQKSYRALFRLSEGAEFCDIRAASLGSWALGSKEFIESLEKRSGIHATPKSRGGDHKSKEFRKSR